jgi:glycosyltransferase involved in cell wall biosynthesis
VDIVICNSRFTETLQLVREPSARTAVVHPPVPPPDRTVDRSTARRELRRELGVPEATTIVLQVGRIERGKGHTAHLEAAASLSDLPDWLIVQVGGVQTPAERRYQTELDRLVSRLGLKDRVRFVGERTDCSRFYAGADVYCQPATLPESFGITLVEALHAGLPVITSDIGASREIVNDECGVLVPGGDVRALAAALRGLVGDTATRECLGRNGPERAAALCDPQFCVTRLHEILSAVAA